MAKEKQLSDYSYAEQLNGIKDSIDSLIQHNNFEWTRDFGVTYLKLIQKQCEYAMDKIDPNRSKKEPIL